MGNPAFPFSIAHLPSATPNATNRVEILNSNIIFSVLGFILVHFYSFHLSGRVPVCLVIAFTLPLKQMDVLIKLFEWLYSLMPSSLPFLCLFLLLFLLVCSTFPQFFLLPAIFVYRYGRDYVEDCVIFHYSIVASLREEVSLF